MTSKTIKCSNYSKCGEEWNFTPIKGSNNTELCHQCGGDICFICGKKEEKFRWEEGEDCCGNKKMIKVVEGMFYQHEKDENHPEGDLRVYYCDEHRLEGEKNPNKWTKEDRERLERKEGQEKLEREEKLNSQGGLFYCKDTYAHCVEWKKIEGIEYGCIYFWGKENGRNFYLMVPDTHPDLVSFKYKEKVRYKNGSEGECTRWTLKKQFYLIEGIDNLPLEATSPHSSQYNVPDSFGKVVGLNDKITIIPVDSQGNPEKNNPVENEPIDNFSKSAEEIKKTLLQYFQQKNIKSIKVENEKLIIKYNSSQTETKDINNLELEQIKSFVEKLGKKELTLSDLEKSSNQSNSADKNNKGLYIGLAIWGVVIIGLVAWLLTRNKKNN